MQKLSNEQKYLLALQAMKFRQALNSPLGENQSAYLEVDRGLSEETLARFQIGAVASPEDFGEDPARADWWDEELQYWGPGRICIPFLTPTGIVLNRYMQPPPRTSPAKYWQPAGSYIGLYNTPRIIEGGDRICVVEGEVDTMSLEQVGIPAVGIPGVGNWARKSHYPTIFAGYEEVIYLQEDDEKPQTNEDGTPKESAAERLGQQLTDDLGNVRIIRLPRGYDSNKILVEMGPDALKDIVQFPHGRNL